MKIIASDFDNTLFVEDEEKFCKNIEAIRKFISYGNLFCIITGRNYPSIKELLLKYEIPYSYLICNDGAKIFNNVDYCFDTTLLDKINIEKIVSVLEQDDCPYYLDDGYNETNNSNDCVKIAVEIENLEKAIKTVEKIKEVSDCYIYMSKNYINITDKLANKYYGLVRLFNKEKLSLSNLYVIGDEVNDVEMVKKFNSAIMKVHNKCLDCFNKDEYDYLYEYIEEVSNLD